MSDRKKITIALMVEFVLLAAYGIILRLSGIEDARALMVESKRMSTIAAWAFIIWSAVSAILLCWALESRKQTRKASP